MTELFDEIQAVRALYPVSRSATLPALRLAQERYGWLSPEAFREVADALEETPAYCMAVASFYDMYHLKPVGRNLVEVCTNISCALVGAQQVLEAFEIAAFALPITDLVLDIFERSRLAKVRHRKDRRKHSLQADVIALFRN